MIGSKVLSARVNTALHTRLSTFAEKRNVKLNDLITEALSFYLDNFAGYAIALARLKNQNDEWIAGDAFTARLGWD